MASTPFKFCPNCNKQFPWKDLHQVCNLCLPRDPVEGRCKACKLFKPKTLKDRKTKHWSHHAMQVEFAIGVEGASSDGSISVFSDDKGEGKNSDSHGKSPTAAETHHTKDTNQGHKSTTSTTRPHTAARGRSTSSLSSGHSPHDRPPKLTDKSDSNAVPKHTAENRTSKDAATAPNCAEKRPSSHTSKSAKSLKITKLSHLVKKRIPETLLKSRASKDHTSKSHQSHREKERVTQGEGNRSATMKNKRRHTPEPPPTPAVIPPAVIPSSSVVC